MTQQNKTSTEETVAQGIRAIMCDRIKDEFDRLITEQVAPWKFFHTKHFQVKKFDGKSISYSGLTFDGTPVNVFWNGYIQPFIKDRIKKMIEETVRLAKEKGISNSAVLYSTQTNLSGRIGAVFEEMQDTDRKLRGKGSPQSISKRDILIEVKQMNAYLDEQVKIYSNLSFESPKSRFQKWHDKSPHIKWLIGIIISVLALAISVFSILSRK